MPDGAGCRRDPRETEASFVSQVSLLYKSHHHSKRTVVRTYPTPAGTRNRSVLRSRLAPVIRTGVRVKRTFKSTVEPAWPSISNPFSDCVRIFAKLVLAPGCGRSL